MQLSKRIVEASLVLLVAATWVGCSSSDSSDGDLQEATDSTIAEPEAGKDADGEKASSDDETSADKPADAPTETVDSADHGTSAPSAELTTPAPSAPYAMPKQVTAATAPAGDGAAASATPAPAPAPAPAAGPYQATGSGKKFWTFEDHVAIHSQPSATAPEVGSIDYGMPVDFLSSAHGWVKIGEGQFVRRRALTDRRKHFYFRKQQDVPAH